MDKVKLTSNGKGALLAVLILAVLLSGGCETTQESSQGISSASGASLDDTGNDNWNLWSLVKKADNWISANLW